MKFLNGLTLLLFGCLLGTNVIIAQELDSDTTNIQKMSYEKADSLLINLVKGRTGSWDAETSSGSFVVAVEPYNLDVETPSDSLIIEEVDTLITNGKRKKVQLQSQSRSVNLTRDDDDREVDFRDLLSVNEGTLVGFGGYKMRDTYLSREKYGGLGVRFMNERMRLTRMANYRISRQNIVNVDISTVLNGAQNANYLSAFADYSVGYHYRFLPDPHFKIMAGGNAHGMLGMVYNTRNGNNPMTVHADFDLNLSLIAIYEFRTKKKSPMAIRYQVETPVAGILFSPVYEQSYYEIFSLGNTTEIFNFNSFHNKFAVRNYLTFDFPVGSSTIRAGYLGSYYSTDINLINRNITSHNVMIGFVKEYVAFGGRELRKRNLFNSAYY